MRFIAMLLIISIVAGLLPAMALAKEEDKNFLEYLARTRPDNKYLVFISRNDDILFAAAGTIGLTCYYIFSQPNKSAKGKAAGKVLSQLKKLF